MNKSGLASSPEVLNAKTSRRNFLRYTGAGVAVTGLLLAGCSDDDEGMVALVAPSGLAASQNDNGDIVLTWTDNSMDETGFMVERSTSATGTFTQVGSTLPANTTTFTDAAANLPGEPGDEYFYRVLAVRGSEMSVPSAVVSSMGGTMAVDLGSGDVGVLNYAYALEQLEAAFYTAVVADASFTSTFSTEEQRILMDLKEHEVAHREFFKAALAENAIPGLMVDFSSIDFGNRESVLATAKTFENLGVAAYNGAGQLLSNPDFLVVAGKIVSVEARHAAVINNLVNPGSTDFAAMPYVDENGLDVAMMPAEVLAAAGPFVVTRIDASNLPTA